MGERVTGTACVWECGAVHKRTAKGTAISRNPTCACDEAVEAAAQDLDPLLDEPLRVLLHAHVRRHSPDHSLRRATNTTAENTSVQSEERRAQSLILWRKTRK